MRFVIRKNANNGATLSVETLDGSLETLVRCLVTETEISTKEEDERLKDQIKRAYQIKDMAQDMDYACVDLTLAQRIEIAKVLHILDYRKIYQDEVVISKKEYEKLISK